MKKFNVTGVCVKRKHYMVDISGKMKEIMQMVYDGYYFTINRGRQYGKTTTLLDHGPGHTGKNSQLHYSL